jgi:hypothetical protein
MEYIESPVSDGERSESHLPRVPNHLHPSPTGPQPEFSRSKGLEGWLSVARLVSHFQ